MAADRQDLDALLIGALYGELDADERARLDAHLASHPQDRSALEEMRSTRAMLRDAELSTLLGSAEPSPAISARLLQEAARRAPVKAAAGGGFFAFLATLFRPLVASPALSAAAALVLVVGAAGVLYSRGALTSDEPTVSRNESVASPAPPGAVTTQPPSAVDDYRVLLDEQAQAAKEPSAAADSLAAEGTVTLDGDGDAVRGNAPARQRAATRSTGKPADSNIGFRTEASGGGAPEKDGKERVAKKTPKSSRLGLTDEAASASRPGYIPMDPFAEDAPTVLTADGRADVAASKREAESKNIAGRAPAPDAPAATAPQKPAQVARDQGKAGGYNPTAAAALESWARDQHARMVKLVNQGKCTDVGVIGADIARRAPDYYQANVANDRQVRSCRAYVDRARRARSDDAKSKAAAPRTPAPAADAEIDAPANTQ